MMLLIIIMEDLRLPSVPDDFAVTSPITYHFYLQGLEAQPYIMLHVEEIPSVVKYALSFVK